METRTGEGELTVWTDAAVLAEAQKVFSPYDAAIRTVPKNCRARDVSKSKISVLFFEGSEPEKDHVSFLHCLKNRKSNFVLFYMPHHSSRAAFRWGQIVGEEHSAAMDWAFNLQHLKQILRARNVLVHARDEAKSDLDLTEIRRRLSFTQEQLAKALNVAPRTIQNWESGVGTSQMGKKTNDLRELLNLMDEFVIAPKEQEWLRTPLRALRNDTPRDAIMQGKLRDLIIEFRRLGEGQPA